MTHAQPAKQHTIGDYIKHQLDERSWSFRDLAARMPYTAPDVHRWIHGERAPTLEACHWLAVAFSGQVPTGFHDETVLPETAIASDAPVEYHRELITIMRRTLQTFGVRPRKSKPDEQD